MKRALLVGINYVGTPNVLYGCINDVMNVATYLQTARNYPAASCVMLSDNTARKPTAIGPPTGLQTWLLTKSANIQQ